MPTMRLPVKLTDIDRLAMYGDLSAAITAQEAAEAIKKAAMKDHNEKIKDLKTTVHTINTSLQTDTVEREVEIDKYEDLETGTIKTKRLDTGEIINTRGMDPEERQLKIGGTSLDDVKAKLASLNTTEEQRIAETPEEAEELRAARLAQEKAESAFGGISIGDEVEIKTGADWVRAKVQERNDFHFDIDDKLYDVSKYGISWRLPATWEEVQERSAEIARQAEIKRLGDEQAKEQGPKHLLKAPKRRPSVQDDSDTPSTDTPPRH